jgi:hypothetical protein
MADDGASGVDGAWRLNGGTAGGRELEAQWRVEAEARQAQGVQEELQQERERELQGQAATTSADQVTCPPPLAAVQQLGGAWAQLTGGSSWQLQGGTTSRGGSRQCALRRMLWVCAASRGAGSTLRGSPVVRCGAPPPVLMGGCGARQQAGKERQPRSGGGWHCCGGASRLQWCKRLVV